MFNRPSFIAQLENKWDEGKFVCVGLDPVIEKLPFHLLRKSTLDHMLTSFLYEIVDATADLVCCFKPNIAFFEWSTEAEEVLKNLTAYIHLKYPDIPVLIDSKRGDIENTNNGYAKSFWERYEFDATTVQTYFGPSTYTPYLKTPGKGVISMCKTSNPDAAYYQDLVIDMTTSLKDGIVTQKEFDDIKKITKNTKVPLYFLVAYRHKELNEKNPNIGIVVGATQSESFEMVRKLYGDGLILIPGIGAQGGSLEETLKFAPNSKKQGMIINSSRGIIYASSDKDFASVARKKTLQMHEDIVGLLQQ